MLKMRAFILAFITCFNGKCTVRESLIPNKCGNPHISAEQRSPKILHNINKDQKRR